VSGLDAVTVIVQFICDSFGTCYSTEDCRFVLDDRNIFLLLLKAYFSPLTVCFVCV